MDSQKKSLLDVADIQKHMELDDFGFGRWIAIQITTASYGVVEAELVVRDDMSRPGGTVAGPVLMGIADAAMWGAAMTVNPVGNQSVTSDFTIHFLSRPAARILRCRAEVIKPGRKIMVMRADITCDDDPRVVCACQGAYAVAPVTLVPDK
ncbi:MAG: PaaI family thioesterase [Burkholderiaceae bacterium]